VTRLVPSTQVDRLVTVVVGGLRLIDWSPWLLESVVMKCVCICLVEVVVKLIMCMRKGYKRVSDVYINWVIIMYNESKYAHAHCNSE